MGRLKALLWAVAGMAVAGAALWWGLFSAQTVNALVPVRGTAVEIVYATGAVEPIRWAKVASLIRDRIIELCDCEGETVRKGDVLARLDDRELQAALQELRAREEFAKREMARVTELIGRGSATTQAYERATTELRTIQALILVQTEKINDYVITAPMDGVVLRRDGEVGEIAEVGQILFRIGVPKPLQVIAEVNEEDITRVEVGQRVLLRTDAFPDRRLEATVRLITPMGDVNSKTYRVRLALPDDTPLRPGMSVEANIITRRKPDALLVPAQAVQGNSVLVIEDGRVRRRVVTVGVRGTQQVEILSGLAETDRIVASGTTRLREGRRVRLAALATAGQ